MRNKGEKERRRSKGERERRRRGGGGGGVKEKKERRRREGEGGEMVEEERRGREENKEDWMFLNLVEPTAENITMTCEIPYLLVMMRSRAFAITFLMLYIYLWILCLIHNAEWTDKGTQFMVQEGALPEKHVVYFSDRVWKEKSERLILVWTPMFFQWFWTDVLAKQMKECAHACSVTSDKSRIQEADAVLFHIFDLWFWLGMPAYRDPSQIWVVWWAEPTTRVWPDLRRFRNTFNWTMTYRRDSTVEAPFAIAVPLTKEEMRANEIWYNSSFFNHMKHKVNNVSITNSDCYDEVQRYRLVEQLRQHVPVDFYGRCGNLSCPRDNAACNDKLRSYKFMIQFENSYCNDYISEKYWSSLSSENIPIVNWKKQQQNYPVIKHSYINIFDFPDIRSAAEYIQKVASDKDLYKSYFKWRTKYKIIQTGIWAQFCNLCDALHDRKRPAQVIRDLQVWLEDDTCRKGTPWAFLERRINRHIFDMGF
ncbi:alpha-(1,3)-fucosyltransferase fut-5-like [Ylistrum balloti]|uniref:alpha-(1,3)-fucosyltransferase fut-5-like n=1 Tax=Ylistrum balloti TaxID=509963 RepID=UPI00290586A6|nr:alpha-(1,3)-fucosyltransferase fut-5-like [Ylistrum balloti]